MGGLLYDFLGLGSASPFFADAMSVARFVCVRVPTRAPKAVAYSPIFKVKCHKLFVADAKAEVERPACGGNREVVGDLGGQPSSPAGRS